MLLIAIIACADAPSTPPSQIVAPTEQDDFASILGMMRKNGCTDKPSSCAILHYGPVEGDKTDYLFAGVATNVATSEATDGTVSVTMEMDGQLWWVHPNRPLTAGLDRLGCGRQTPCLAYLDGNTLRVWAPQSGLDFDMPTN